MLAPHTEHTARRGREHGTILSLQDAVYLDYSKRGKPPDLDIFQRSNLAKSVTGLMLHNTLDITTKSEPLELFDQWFIARKSFHGDNAQQKKQICHCNDATIDKESRRWFGVVKKVADIDVGDTRVVHVADRERDIYEFFCDECDIGQHVLVRAARNRSIDKTLRREPPGDNPFDKVRGKRAKGKMDVCDQVNSTKKFRTATLSIIHMLFSMPPPNKTVTKDRTILPMVPLHAIMAIESRPTKSAEPIECTLLTDLKIGSLDDAIEKVHSYAKRWYIDVFHKALKSGCGVENAQLRSAERLKNHTVLKSIVAWRLIWFGRLHEIEEKTSCEMVLSEEQYSLLYRKANKTKERPTTAPTVGEV